MGFGGMRAPRENFEMIGIVGLMYYFDQTFSLKKVPYYLN